MKNEFDFSKRDYSFTKPITKTIATVGGVVLATQARPLALAAGMILATAGAPITIIGCGMGVVYYGCATAPTTIPMVVDTLYDLADTSADAAIRADFQTKINQACSQYQDDKNALLTRIDQIFTEHGITQGKLESVIGQLDFQNYMISTMTKDRDFYTAMNSLDGAFNLACAVFPNSKIIAKASQIGHIGTQAARLSRHLKEFNTLSNMGKVVCAADLASLGLMIIQLFSSNDSALMKSMQQLLQSIEELHKDVMREFADVKHMLNEIYREVLSIKWAIKDIDALVRSQAFRLENIVSQQGVILRASVSELTEAVVYNASKNTLFGRFDTDPDHVSEDDLLTPLRDCYAWGLEHARMLKTLTGYPESRFDARTATAMLKQHTAKNRISYLGEYFRRKTKSVSEPTSICNPTALTQAAQTFVQIVARYKVTRRNDFSTALARQFSHNKKWLLYMAAIMLLEPATSKSTRLTAYLPINIVTPMISTVMNVVRHMGFNSTIAPKDALFFCGVIPVTGLIGCAFVEKRWRKLSLTNKAYNEIIQMRDNYFNAMLEYHEFIKSIQTHPDFLISLIDNYDQAITEFEKTIFFDDLGNVRAQIKSICSQTSWPDHIQKIDADYWLCRRFIELALPISSISDPLLTALFSGQERYSQGVFSAEMLMFQLEGIEKKHSQNVALKIACRELFRSAHLISKLLRKVIDTKQNVARNSATPFIECDDAIVKGAEDLSDFSLQCLNTPLKTNKTIPLASAYITTVDTIATDLDEKKDDDIAIALEMGVGALNTMRSRGALFTVKPNEASLLHVAAFNENIGALKLLLESGVPIDHVDDDGNNALHYAAAGHSFLVVPFLIEAGISHKSKNKFNEIPKSLLPTELHETFNQCVAMPTNGQLSEYKKAETHIENNEPADAIECYKKLISVDDQSLASAKAALEQTAQTIEQHRAAIAKPKDHHYSKKAIPGLQKNLQHYLSEYAQYQAQATALALELPEPWKLFVRKQLDFLSQSLQALDNNQNTDQNNDRVTATNNLDLNP